MKQPSNTQPAICHTIRQNYCDYTRELNRAPQRIVELENEVERLEDQLENFAPNRRRLEGLRDLPDIPNTEIPERRRRRRLSRWQALREILRELGQDPRPLIDPTEETVRQEARRQVGRIYENERQIQAIIDDRKRAIDAIKRRVRQVEILLESSYNAAVKNNCDLNYVQRICY